MIAKLQSRVTNGFAFIRTFIFIRTCFGIYKRILIELFIFGFVQKRNVRFPVIKISMFAHRDMPLYPKI
jgi:hypothetical protein